MSGNYLQKISALWTSFLLGTLFHTDLGLMPLFHDMKVEHSHATGDLNAIFGFMLVFFALPMLAIIAPTFTDAKPYRTFHFGLTIAYSVMNLGHLIADIAVKAPWYQLVLMALLLSIGLLLNLVSFQWLKSSIKSKNLPEKNSY
jgi:succinate-acetate transporter protein